MTRPVTLPTFVSRLRPPPLRPETIARERLLRDFDRAAERPLTLVCAPPGFGKTTAVVQWLEKVGLSHAWLSVDASDNDPRQFAARLLAVLDRAVPGQLESARHAFEGGSDIEVTVVPLLANALADSSGPDLVLVLDDYHLISEPACHRVTSALVDSRPARLGVLIASRESPPLRLGRRRAAGTLAELGPDQLRFEPAEADRLLNGPLELGLDREQVALIDERLSGWAAGLALVGSAIAGRSDRGDFLAALEASRESLDSYLSEEVLDAIGPELSEFLRRTSILGELSAPLCEAVSGDPRAGELLRQARRMNLFLTPLDPEGEWLRFHDVFATMLRNELRRSEREQVCELHRRASVWYEENGRAEEAMDHAVRAGDGPRAAALLAANWIGLITERRYVTLRRVLSRLPEDRGEFGPLCEALDLLCMIFEGIDQRATAERARKLVAAHGEDPLVRLVVDGILTSPFYGDVAAAAEVGHEAWERYAELPPARDRLVGPYALVLWFAGEYDRVRELLEPRVLLEQPTFQKVWTRAILALTAADEGDAETGERLGREAMAEVVDAGAETATEFAGLPWLLGEILRHRGKLREARVLMDRGIANEERRPGSVGHTVALVFDAQLALAEGERERARRSAQQARGIIDRYPDLGTLSERLAAVESALSGAADQQLLGSEPTGAELRVLALLDGPLSLAEVATELYVSRETVKSHTRRLYRRLGVSTREEAISAARERGLLPGDGSSR